jgi:site-specific DNA recombinase
MTKVAIYARYSSDLQGEASIDDQIRTCKARAQTEGWQVLDCYADHATSGASLMRPGIQMLMQHAAEGKFDILLSEALDRLSRDQADIATVFKRMKFAGVQIVTLSEGEISNLHIGLKGTMNALFLQDLAHKTRRGLSGRIEKGKSGGGICYGYDVVRRFNDAGEAIRGDRSINEEQAEVVRRIFRDYALGKSAKAIAHQLNKEAIACPCGDSWGQSTINGNRRRGTGILNNELYIGVLVWNRQRFIKDPDSGRRVARLNPEESWMRREVPELRIVDQDLWDRVKTRQKDLDAKGDKFYQKRRPPHLFSYLLKCGCCNGGFSKISQSHYGCSTARNKGTCDNFRTVKQEILERSVLTSLREGLMDPKLCEVFCEEYTRYVNELRMERTGATRSLQAELVRLERDRQRVAKAVLAGVNPDSLKAESDRVVTRRKEIEEILENADEEAPVLLHPSMALRYRNEIAALTLALDGDNNKIEAKELLRGLIERIVLTPAQGSDGLTIDLYGDLAGILSLASKRPKSDVQNALRITELDQSTEDGRANHGNRVGRKARSSAQGQVAVETSPDLSPPKPESHPSGVALGCGPEPQVKLVAGAGFEPATFGL